MKFNFKIKLFSISYQMLNHVSKSIAPASITTVAFQDGCAKAIDFFKMVPASFPSATTEEMTIFFELAAQYALHSEYYSNNFTGEPNLACLLHSSRRFEKKTSTTSLYRFLHHETPLQRTEMSPASTLLIQFLAQTNSLFQHNECLSE